MGGGGLHGGGGSTSPGGCASLHVAGRTHCGGMPTKSLASLATLLRYNPGLHLPHRRSWAILVTTTLAQPCISPVHPLDGSQWAPPPQSAGYASRQCWRGGPTRYHGPQVVMDDADVPCFPCGWPLVDVAATIGHGTCCDRDHGGAHEVKLLPGIHDQAVEVYTEDMCDVVNALLAIEQGA